MMDIILDDDRI